VVSSWLKVRKPTFYRIVIVVFIALIAPVFSYTIYQISQRDRDEALIYSIYDRQLGSLLFSVNQFCWDVFHTWVSELQTITQFAQDHNEDSGIEPAMMQMIEKNMPVAGNLLFFPNQRKLLVWREKDRSYVPYSQSKALELLDSTMTVVNNELNRMVQQVGEGYIRPVILSWPSASKDMTLLLFATYAQSRSVEEAVIAGVFLDDEVFIQEVVARKFSEMDDGNFVFAVKNQSDGHVLFSTLDDEAGEAFEKNETLWILPDLMISVKLHGITLEQISHKRTQKNMLLIFLVNVALILGVVYLLRNISREMTLARMKTDFVANVSHELRTPLALIRMHAETLELGRVHSEKKRNKYYKIIMNESTRLSQLINNVLDFSRIESKRKKYCFEQVDLSHLVKDVLNMYRYHIEQHGFDIETDISTNSRIIQADRDAVTLAFVNLLDNAIKYSKGNKRILIRVEQHEKDVSLSVQDFGIGISEQEQKKIFEKFYRVGSSLVHNTKGSGLGLSLVQHIMEVHRGRVSVSSRLGRGSIFVLAFPVK